MDLKHLVTEEFEIWRVLYNVSKDIDERSEKLLSQFDDIFKGRKSVVKRRIKHLQERISHAEEFLTLAKKSTGVFLSLETIIPETSNDKVNSAIRMLSNEYEDVLEDVQRCAQRIKTIYGSMDVDSYGYNIFGFYSHGAQISTPLREGREAAEGLLSRVKVISEQVLFLYRYCYHRM